MTQLKGRDGHSGMNIQAEVPDPEMQTLRGTAGRDSFEPSPGDVVEGFDPDEDILYIHSGHVTITQDGADLILDYTNDPELNGQVRVLDVSLSDLGDSNTQYGYTEHIVDDVNYFEGTPANDQIFTYVSNTQVYGHAGEDDIRILGGGNTTVWGGNDRDLIDAKLGGDDKLYGEEGNDAIWGRDGNDSIYGGAGSDTLHGGNGDDFLDGGSDADWIYAGVGNDTLVGGSQGDGADEYRFSDDFGSAEIRGFDSSEDKIDLSDLVQTFSDLTISASNGGSLITLPDHRTIFIENVSPSSLKAKHFHLEGDNLQGTDGPDTLIGSARNERIEGGRGNDLISGSDGNDTLLGDYGDDTLAGGTGNDILFGSGGADLLYANAGNDILNLGTSNRPEDLLTVKNIAYISSDFNSATIINFNTHADRIDISEVASSMADFTKSVHEDEIKLTLADGRFIAIRPYSGFTMEWLNSKLSSEHFIFGDHTEEPGANPEPDPSPDQGTEDADSIEGTDSNDTLRGNDGNDTLDGGAGGDVLSGGAGNDEISGGDGNDIVWAGGGDDNITGGDGDDQIGTGAGNDVVDGGAGANLIFGADGNDTITLSTNTSTAGNGVAWGGNGNDEIYGGSGDDRIGTGNGNDAAEGGAGDDTLYGGSADYADELDGGSGDDELYGGGGGDALEGGSGDDVIWGGAGDDTITGGAGDDEISGGPGSDELIFTSGHGDDVVASFSVGDDMLDLSGTNTNFTSAGDVQAAASNTTVSGDAGVMIDTGGGNSIFLIGITTTNLLAVDYTF